MLNVLPLVVTSEDEKEYVTDLWRPTSFDLERTWMEYSKYRVLFSDITVNDFQTFFGMVMAPGTVVLDIKHQGETVGLLYATELRVGTSALGHYVFWDRRTAGRQRLILTLLRTGMKELALHRIAMSIPIYAYHALRRVYKMGLRIEGRRREGILYEGKWQDIIEFSVLQTELTEERARAGRLPGNSPEWDHFIDKHLMDRLRRGEHNGQSNGT